MSRPELAPHRNPVGEILVIMGKLGCIAFGGPVAHLAWFQRELVAKRRWIGEQEYTDLIAFAQFLPGPASSQVGMCLGLRRGGLLGMFAAWFAFTMPTVILLLAAAAGIGLWAGGSIGWLQGLLAAVVAIVADAVLKLGRKCCPDAKRLSMAIIAAGVMLLVPTSWMQLIVIGLGAVVGLALLREPALDAASEGRRLELGRGTMVFGWCVLLLLVLLPVVLAWVLAPEHGPLAIYAAFAQTGALVFGGGHVVLPMLQAEVVPPDWVDDQQFLAGYGVTQAMPGPIFSFAAYLGATIGQNVAGWGSFFGYGMLALLGIYMPSFGLVAGLMPLWHKLRASPRVRRALLGINAAVIGLLIAALYRPVWTKAMAGGEEVQQITIVLGAWLLLVVWQLPAWLVVAAAAGAGALLG